MKNKEKGKKKNLKKKEDLRNLHMKKQRRKNKPEMLFYKLKEMKNSQNHKKK